MTDQPDKIGQAVNGYQQLAARQVTIYEWRILSWRNDGLTAYKVDTKQLSCNCPDHAYNRDDGQVCDHIAVALYAASQRLDVGTALQRDLADRQMEMENMVQRLERQATALESEAAGLSEAADGDDDQELEAGGMTKSDAEYVYEYLEERGVPREKVEVWESDQGSVQIETQEQLDDDEFAVIKDTDEIWYDGENNRNYIKEDNLGELLG